MHGLSVLQLSEDCCWSRGSFVKPPLIVSRAQTLPISLLWTLSALYTRWYQSFRFTSAQQTLPFEKYLTICAWLCSTAACVRWQFLPQKVYNVLQVLHKVKDQFVDSIFPWTEEWGQQRKHQLTYYRISSSSCCVHAATVLPMSLFNGWQYEVNSKPINGGLLTKIMKLRLKKSPEVSLRIIQKSKSVSWYQNLLNVFIVPMPLNNDYSNDLLSAKGHFKRAWLMLLLVVCNS